MKVYIIIREIDDHAITTPEVFTNYENARKRWDGIIKETWDRISNGDDDLRDDVLIEEEDKDTLVYYDKYGVHATLFYECETQDKEQEVK